MMNENNQRWKNLNLIHKNWRFFSLHTQPLSISSSFSTSTKWTTRELINFFIDSFSELQLCFSFSSSIVKWKNNWNSSRISHGCAKNNSTHLNSHQPLSAAKTRDFTLRHCKISISLSLELFSLTQRAHHHIHRHWQPQSLHSTDTKSLFISLCSPVSTECQSARPLRQHRRDPRWVALPERRRARCHRTECRWPGWLVALLAARKTWTVSRKSTASSRSRQH